MTNPFPEGIDLDPIGEPIEEVLEAAAQVALAWPGDFARRVAEIDERVKGVWAPMFVRELDRRYAWGARAWDPWAALRNRLDITLKWAQMGEGHYGAADGRPGAWTITLDSEQLDRRGIRCTLAHELIHVERAIVKGPAAIMEREEAIVRAETARRLVPTAMLAELLGRSEDGFASTDTKPIEDEFDVTEAVAAEAIALLRAQEPEDGEGYE